MSTPSSSTIAQTIRLLYGQTLAKELLRVTTSSAGKGDENSNTTMDTSDDEEMGDEEASETWSAEAHFTSANYQAKKMVLLLFINRKCATWRVWTSDKCA